MGKRVVRGGGDRRWVDRVHQVKYWEVRLGADDQRKKSLEKEFNGAFILKKRSHTEATQQTATLALIPESVYQSNVSKQLQVKKRRKNLT